MNIDYKSHKLYSLASVLLVFILFLMFLINNTGFVKSFAVKSSLWLAVIIFMLIFLPKSKGSSKIKQLERFYLFSFICGIIYLLVYFGSGVILGFGKSPYAQGIKGISMNIYFFIIPIIARELIRGFLLNSPVKQNSLKITSITILMIVTDISILQIMKIDSLKSLVIFLSQNLGPLICINIFASYACVISNPAVSIIFLSFMTAGEIVPPVLPSLQWLTRGLINMSVPIFSYMSMNSYHEKLAKRYKPYKLKHENIFSLAAVSIFCILLIWFSVGVFPVYPSVILTGSMKPVINPGDIVVIKKIQELKDIESLKAGDIIQFKRDEIMIVHRITELVKNEDDGLTYFRTKGDNNSTEDKNPVNPNDIKGTVYKTIPKLGLPALILRNNDNIPLDDIEF